ncbi:Ca-activated chloride channel family protein [Chitinivorax tropicus]|uniref:Ca-activated chloride channel family protein n=1 Tax=Chitinivorax tropicus TaxID=714531 RepID=A0A840MU48_9PROT|nr:VWA domain-containing protein [Chitinivorax tropicus]MBB5020322.1 Ca-activated chloride channel family protein [Chitinivorax tropicus]
MTTPRPLVIALALIFSVSACGKRDMIADEHPTPKQVEEQVASTPANAPVATGLPSPPQSGAVHDQATNSPRKMAPALVAERMAMPAPAYVTPQANTEKYQQLDQHDIKLVAQTPVSTFSIDVDTGAYANMRRFLNEGQLPPADAVRIEEFINYFPYQYNLPQQKVAGKLVPFGVVTEIAPTPWNPDSLLLRVGIKASDVAKATLPPANLVFLVDVSGSMNEPAKLPLVKNALKMLVNQLRPQDRISLVTYASGTRVILEPTPGTEKAKISSAIDQLQPGGSTAGAAGIQLAYQMAAQGFLKEGINRILLATDGDFNVGINDFNQLKSLVEEKRKSGVSLSSLGFGTGNYNEQLMEQIADAGDGNYSYIDNLNEAQKVLSDELSSTLAVVAKDVKVQLEFNPNVVAEYRQIGYENRALKREDFNNDKVDAGEIGAGHSVTALYEITLVGGKRMIEDLRYDTTKAAKPVGGKTDELAFLRLRYKAPGTDSSELLEFPLFKRDIKAATQTSEDFRFAAAVAAFGQELKGGKYTGRFGYDQIQRLADSARGNDPFGYRGEFVRLVNLAKSLSTQPNSQP